MKIEDILESLPSKRDIASAIGMGARPSTGSDAIVGLGILSAGIVVGAGLALLLAPKTGEQTRHDIAEKVGELSAQLRTPTGHSADVAACAAS